MVTLYVFVYKLATGRHPKVRGPMICVAITYSLQQLYCKNLCMSRCTFLTRH